MDTISFSDFQKFDIRIGTVVEASVPEWSHWVMKLTVDFASEAKSAKNRPSRRVRHGGAESREVRSGGEEEIGTKTIFAGIMKHYKPEELVGKQFPFVVNIEPKKIGPKEADGTQNYSQGMMLTACDAAGLRAKGQGPKESKDLEEIPVLLKLWKKVPNGTKVR